MIVCVHEDRPQAFVGLQLTLLSLRRHCPQVPVAVSCPGATPDLLAWLRQLSLPVLVSRVGQARGWDVKPDLLLDLLADGHDDVVWIDSDILVTAALPEPLVGADPAAVVVTEEPYWDTREPVDRAAAWGLPPGRRLPCTLNTGLLRVTPKHVPLLEAWRELLTAPSYRAAQEAPWRERPRHLMGAQGVLEALLMSRRFCDVPVVVLRRGTHIAQCHGAAGYTPVDRLRTLASGRRVPPLVHALGDKPWDQRVVPGPPRVRLVSYVNRLHHELSPYTRSADEYREDLPDVRRWSRPRSRVARVLATLTGGHPVLQELPLALLDGAARRVRPAGRRLR
jgi:hypothetical protein